LPDHRPREGIVNYELAYRVGFHPWEDAEAHAPFAQKLSELLDEEERGAAPPFGRALDVGTGSGIWAVYLAKRGWGVTGVDIVEKALERARARVAEEEVDVRLVHGDVTALDTAAVGAGFELVLDTGTLHRLKDDERTAMGRAIESVASPNATVLLLAWPKRRRPLIRGVTVAEIEGAFPGWAVEDAGPSYFQAPKPIELIMRPDERWYRLRRA